MHDDTPGGDCGTDNDDDDDDDDDDDYGGCNLFQLSLLQCSRQQLLCSPGTSLLQYLQRQIAHSWASGFHEKCNFER